MISIKEKIAGFETQVKALESDKALLQESNDGLQAELAAFVAERDAEKAQFAAQAEASAQKIAELEKNLADVIEAGKAIEAERDELKAKVELVPAVADQSEGQQPVADGSVKADEVDLIAELNKMPMGSAQAIAFYRANKKEIDAASKK